MNCQRVSDDELVERYLNGQLDPAVQDDLEVHILECPECLSRAEALSAIRANLAPRARKIGSPAKTTRRQQVAWMRRWILSASLEDPKAGSDYIHAATAIAAGTGAGCDGTRHRRGNACSPCSGRIEAETACSGTQFNKT